MTQISTQTSALASLTLGKVTDYKETYCAELLQAVPRSLNRQSLDLGLSLPFSGCDRWNGYELSWLNSKGKPQVAILRCEVPVTSANLIESKSFKLYLNSFNQSSFNSMQDVWQTIRKDLSKCAGEDVQLFLFSPSQFEQMHLAPFKATHLDELDIEVSEYNLNPALLTVENTQIEECLTSDLLKSNCLITNQPDWASVLIKYAGAKINHANLLRYLISFRQHNEFHEQCIERIFCDIMKYCKPEKLTVYARYTRRGGLDINPFRSNFETIYSEQRLARQ